MRKIAVAFEQAGLSSLDAPFSGGDIGAKNGSLAVMVGGPEDAFEKVLPIFKAMGRIITHVGQSGAGQIVKVTNQIMVAAQMVAMGELLILAKKAGADPQKVVAAIQGGAAQCWALDNKPQRLFAGQRDPGFKIYLQTKDLNIVMDTAREYGVPFPITGITTQLYQAMVEMGLQDLDNSAVIAIFETLSATQLV